MSNKLNLNPASDTEVLNILDRSRAVYQAALEVLNNWDFAKNKQIPELTEEVSAKLGVVNDSDKKDVDQHIRYLVKMHSAFESKRGAGGGITLSSIEAGRKATKDARLAAKAEASAKVEEKLTDNVASDSSEENSSDSSEESDELV